MFSVRRLQVRFQLRTAESEISSVERQDCGKIMLIAKVVINFFINIKIIVQSCVGTDFLDRLPDVLFKTL